MEITTAQNLKRLRQMREVRQREAAAALGVSQALLSHYENGVREPGFAFLCRACEYYGVTADYLIGRTRVPGCTGPGAALEEALGPLFRRLRAQGGEEAEQAAFTALACALYRTLPPEDTPTASEEALALLTAQARWRLARPVSAEPGRISREDGRVLDALRKTVEAMAEDLTHPRHSAAGGEEHHETDS